MISRNPETSCFKRFVSFQDSAISANKGLDHFYVYGCGITERESLKTQHEPEHTQAIEFKKENWFVHPDGICFAATGPFNPEPVGGVDR